MDISTGTLIGLCIIGYAVSTIGSLGGVGGGALLIPLYSFIGSFELKQSVVLSVFTITGASLVRGIYSIPKRQRNVKNRYLANYGIIVVVVPFSNNTSYLGVVLNQYLPTIVIFLIFVAIMYYLIYRNLVKNWEYLKEFLKKDSESTTTIAIDGIELILPITTLKSEVGIGETWLDVVTHLIFVICGFGFVAFFTFMRNSSTMPWLIYSIQFILITAYGYICLSYVKQNYMLRKKTGFHFISGDIVWNSKKSIIIFVGLSLTIGVLSSLLGIGGSIVITPVLIGLGVPPDVIVATGSIISFFSSTISSLQYFVAGDYIEWYLSLLFVSGSLGAITSIIIIHIFKKGIKLLIVTAISFILILSLALLICYNILHMIEHGVV
jgi:uncharacterized membrane protein YfcA